MLKIIGYSVNYDVFDVQNGGANIEYF